MKKTGMNKIHETITVNYITSPQIENGIFVFKSDHNGNDLAKYALTELYKEGYHLDGSDIDQIARVLKVPTRSDAKRRYANWANQWGYQINSGVHEEEAYKIDTCSEQSRCSC